MSMFGWLRRREGKRTVVESAKPEPVDPIDEVVSLDEGIALKVR